MKVLGFESSCDETGVALVDSTVEGVPRLIAHALHSQVQMHEAYGGVVPELASRDHLTHLPRLTRCALDEAGIEARAISQTKGCYVGQEIVARMESLGKPKQVVTALRIVGEAGSPSNAALCSFSKVTRTTSAPLSGWPASRR